MVTGVQDQSLRFAIPHPGRDAGSADGQVGASFQPLHGENIGFAGLLEGFPGAGFCWWVDKATHKEVVALVGCPEQFQAGNRGTLAQFLAVADQGFRDGEMIRLVNQGEAVLLEPVCNGADRQTCEVEIEKAEQINSGDAVFDRHPVTALQNHRLTTGQQHQRGERVNRRCARAPVVGHAETQRCSTASSGLQHRAMGSVGVEHPREFLGFGPSDAMGNQEGADLCGRRFALQHQLHGISRFLATHAFAGVFTASHLAQVLLEAVAAGENCARQRSGL